MSMCRTIGIAKRFSWNFSSISTIMEFGKLLNKVSPGLKNNTESFKKLKKTMVLVVYWHIFKESFLFFFCKMKIICCLSYSMFNL